MYNEFMLILKLLNWNSAYIVCIFVSWVFERNVSCKASGRPTSAMTECLVWSKADTFALVCFASPFTQLFIGFDEESVVRC